MVIKKGLISILLFYNFIYYYIYIDYIYNYIIFRTLPFVARLKNRICDMK